MTCCLFSSLKTLLIPSEATGPPVGVNVPVDSSIAKRPYMAGIEVTMYGRIWVTPEVWEHSVSNNRLQLTEIGLGTTQGGVDRLKLNFDYGTTSNNGNLLTQTTTVPGSPSLSIVQSYGYNDGLNRLTSVQETANQTVRWT
jgi:hypothetical protein